MSTIMKLSLGKKPENDEHLDITTLIKQLGQKLEELTYFAKESAKIGEDGCPKYHFASFELELKTRLMALGRLVCTLFLTLAENELKNVCRLNFVMGITLLLKSQQSLVLSIRYLV